MTPERRQLLIRSEILRSLGECEGYLMPQDTLLHMLRLSGAIRPALLESEYTGTLRELEAGQYISGLHPELGGPVKWKLTERGRAALSELS